ncbi:hypothetical protein [Haladaptatus sp. DFWS20]|uniref:hypothetical protein n=1 Tax=Haladaptatus sp. DFWS20 TaxID=3403467 RepID=UPI003EB77203
MIEYEEPLLKLRAPMSPADWSAYVAPLTLMAGILLVLMLVVAGIDGFSVVVAFVVLCLGTIAAGLVVYNLLMVVVIWHHRR